ncbi:hypothetical protein [uncultured Corynebacterium sp.]|uniref:hypothetical protein n=1 Tax=uncultured Corynebacterium sp. TaxID=159447 RepID=UPI0025F47965|nr:hypothetical protein [uncultured Corynebacterium sp.]
MTSSPRTSTDSPLPGRHRAHPARSQSPVRHRLAAVAAASGLAAAGLAGVSSASAADLPPLTASSGHSSPGHPTEPTDAEAATTSTDLSTESSLALGLFTEEDGAVSSAVSTGNDMIDKLLDKVAGSVPTTDITGSLIATVGSLATGSLAAGSWEGLPGSSAGAGTPAE